MTNKKLINRIVLFTLFVAYLIFNGILLARHELWRDEANVWLMGMNLSPFQLLAEIKYQGHPCLWYLLVMPFAKLDLPFVTIGVISLLIMSVATGVFLWKAPLHPPIKAICIFSPIFTYFYSTIARNYCLIALILILLAWNYPKRNDGGLVYGLLLGLLVQADTIAIAVSGMISFMWLCEGVYKSCRDKSLKAFKPVLIGIWIPLVSLLFWILQFYQVSDSPVYSTRTLGMKELLNEVKNFAFAILIRMTGWEKGICILFLLILLLVSVVVSVRMRNFWSLAVLTVTFGFYAFFSAVIYQLHIWHHISLCFVLIWSIWVFYDQKKEKQADDKVTKVSLWSMEVLLCVFAIGMFLNWNSEREPSNFNNAWNGVYSDGVYAAEYMQENVSPSELIVSDNIPLASTVLAYLKDYEFYYAGSGKVATYADWSEEQSQIISLDELMLWVSTNFPDRQEFYLLWTSDSCVYNSEALVDCEVIYQSNEKTARGEEYTLYRIYCR